MSVDALTSRARVLTAFAGGKPDRVPVSPYIHTSWLESQSPASVAGLLGATDPLVCMTFASELHWLAGREGMARWRREVQGDLLVDHLDTPRGPLRQVSRLAQRRRADREHYLTGPLDYAEDVTLGRTVHVLERFCSTPADLERFLSVPYVPAQLDLSVYRAWEQRLGESALLMANCYDALCLARTLFSIADFARLVQSRDTTRELFAIVNRRVLDVVSAAIAGGVKAFCIVAPELVLLLLNDPGRYADLVAPYDAPLHDLIRERGAYAMVHMHGPVMDLLPAIAATRPHALEPLEGPPGGDVDLATAKRLVGDRLCLVGNLHDFAVLHDAAPSALRRAALDCLAAAAADGGYVLSGTHTGIYDDTAVANWLRIARLVRRHGLY